MTKIKPPRQKVWLALSDLFLDTDVRLHQDYIVRTLRECQFDLATLDRIFIDEVYPVCVFNLYDVAGEWAGFPEDWLFARLENQRTKWQPFSSIRRQLRVRRARAVVPEWFVIREILIAEGLD